jgi:hypothetical protein
MKESAMPFSACNWAVVIVLDVLLRAASVVIPIFMLFVIPWSFIHLAILISLSAYIRTFQFRPRSAVLVTLGATNVLFAIAWVAWSLFFSWRARYTFCFTDTDRCTWVNGIITWPGVQALAVNTLVQIGINLLPVLIVFAFSRRARKHAMA